MVSDRGANAALCRAVTSRSRRSAGRGHLHLSGYVLLDDGSRDRGTGRADLGSGGRLDDVGRPAVGRALAAAGAGRFLPLGRPASTCCCPTTPNSTALGGPDAVLDVARRGRGHPRARSARPGSPGRSASTCPRPRRTGQTRAGRTRVADFDSTGAGDAFNAGLLAAWVPGAEPRDALFAGVAAGTAAASRLGARPDRAAGTSRVEARPDQAAERRAGRAGRIPRRHVARGLPVRIPRRAIVGRGPRANRPMRTRQARAAPVAEEPRSVSSGTLSTISRRPGGSARSWLTVPEPPAAACGRAGRWR